MAVNLTGIQTGGRPTLTGLQTGPVTAGGQLSVEDAALQRDLQKLLFGDQGVYAKISARGIPLTDAGGNMSPEAAYYANLAATEFAGTREQQQFERGQSQQRIDIQSREADLRSKALNNQSIAALGTGAASLGSFAFGRPDSPGRALVNWLWDRYGGAPGSSQTPTAGPGGPVADILRERLPGSPGEGIGMSDADWQRIFGNLSMDQIQQMIQTGQTFGVPEGYQLPAEFGGLDDLNAPATALYDPEALAELSAYLGTPLDLGTTTGLTDMDALLSFLA